MSGFVVGKHDSRFWDTQRHQVVSNPVRRSIKLNPNLLTNQVYVNQTSAVTPVANPTDLYEMIMVAHFIEDELVLEWLNRFGGLQLLGQHLLYELTIPF